MGNGDGSSGVSLMMIVNAVGKIIERPYVEVEEHDQHTFRQAGALTSAIYQAASFLEDLHELRTQTAGSK
jgi:hypothetical protein